MRRAAFVFICACGVALSPFASYAQSKSVSDSDVVDAYIYFLSRLLVLRQEQRDFTNGFEWNKIIHRKPGGVEWANPNLDVAYSEAWVAVDDATCTMLEVPPIEGRYYTVQALNGWGETVANINDRNYPWHPSGRFAFCQTIAVVELPADVQRVNVPGDKTRLLARIELGKDPDEAIRLQQQMTMRPLGKPKIGPTVAVPDFPNDQLPGVEAFDNASAILRSDPDINEGMEPLQAKVQAVADAVVDPAQRARIDTVIRTQAIPEFFAALKSFGLHRNGWQRPTVIGNYGNEYLDRTLINFAGIWANNNREAVYFKGDTDGTGKPLDGSNVYTMTFPANALPGSLARYFWSVIAVDAEKYQVIPNPLNRYLLNNQSGLQINPDGLLTLVLANEQPAGIAQQNWLPTPAGKNYSLTFRFYGPSAQVASGGYFPPPLVRQDLQEGRAVKPAQ